MKLQDNLRELVNHIDYFYEQIRSDYKDDVFYEVYLKEGRWTITSSDDSPDFGTTCPNIALDFMIKARLDLLMFHRMLHQQVATEGVLLKKKLATCAELVGEDSIIEVEGHWETFANGIVDVIKEMSEEKPKLRIV